jgi:hypothetical protein
MLMKGRLKPYHSRYRYRLTLERPAMSVFYLVFAAKFYYKDAKSLKSKILQDDVNFNIVNYYSSRILHFC